MSVSSIENISSLISSIQGTISQFDPTLYTSMADSYTTDTSTGSISTSSISTDSIFTDSISTSSIFTDSISTSSTYISSISRRRNNTALSNIFKQIAYLTLTSTLREYPYEFSDDLVLLSENELENMSLIELIQYNNNVSTSAASELSTIKQNQAIKNQYDIMCMISKSTIDGLGYELQINKANQNNNTTRKNYLYEQSTMYISSITALERNIDMQQDIIYRTESSISDIKYDSHLVDSTIIGQTIDGISTGIGYSSLYIVSLGFTDKLQETISSVIKTSTMLKEDILELEYAHQSTNNLIDVQKKKSGDLSTLYIRRGELDSLVTSQGIAERQAIKYRDSTLSAINTLSSMYKLTDLTYKYAISLSTSRAFTNTYSDRLSTFTQADIAYNNTIPQSGGANITPILGNTILWTARSMAQTALENASTNKTVADNDVVNAQKLANIANTDQYNTVIEELSKTVMSKIRRADTVRKYKESTLQKVVYFSSIYDKSIKDVKKYNDLLKNYSSFYESSLIGLTDIRIRNKQDTDIIDREQVKVDALSFSIPYLRDTYNESVSRTRRYIDESTLYTSRTRSALDNMIKISSFYVSTYQVVNRLKSRIIDLSGIIQYNDGLVFEHSSILNSENIKLEQFGVQIKNSLNIQERAAYEYRETYCRVKRVELDKKYEAQVLIAINAADTETKRLRVANPTLTITPVTVNLNAANVTNVQIPLNTINTFLTYFDTVYNAYDTQFVNINSLSTSIGAKYNSWSTLKVYDSDNYYSVPRIPSIQNKVTSLNTDFSAAKGIVSGKLEIYNNKQNDIQSIKTDFMASYVNIFNATEISAQNTTISSFIIEGYNQAINMLSQNGVVLDI